jgi:hypothetical protein
MVLLLKTRFLQSIRPFGFYLKTIGVFLHLTDSPVCRFSCLVFSCFSFALTFQAGLYVFVERSVLDIRYAFSGQSSRGINFTKQFSRIDAFATGLATTNPFLCGSATSLLLVATSRETVRLFCFSLETMDRLTKRPDLKSLRRYSIAAVTWIAITVTCLSIFK